MRRIDEVMTAPPLATVEPATAVSDAIRRMAERGISHLIVVDADRVVGVVCACDLDGAALCAPVGEQVVRGPLTVDARASAYDAARCMLEHAVGCLPVLDGAALVGIVTRSDLRRARVLETSAPRCAACGDDDHVRCAAPGQCVGFCLSCRRSSVPPGADEGDIGGG